MEKQYKFNWFDLPGSRNVHFQGLLFQLQQTECFKPEQLEHLQFDNVRRMMHYCVEHVPYYKNEGYTVPDNWDDWHKLPVLSRKAVQDRQSELVSKAYDPKRDGKKVSIKSSGSTGRPIEVFTSERAQTYWQAFTVRDHFWQKRDFSGSMCVIKFFPGDEASLPGVTSKSWGAASSKLYVTGPCVAINSASPTEGIFERLLELKPNYLLAYPSVLVELARLNNAAGKTLSFDGITTIGETLSMEHRHFCEESFNTKIADIYSCQELGYLALQCPHHDHYHVQSESCLLEVLDENDQPCAPGEMGRVVVTSFHNFVMPLIRYEVGDYAVVGESSCDSGINLPVLERIVGRTRNLVTYPDGTRGWPAYNPMKIMETLPGSQFQLIQKSKQNILVKIVYDRALTEEEEALVKSIITTAIKAEFRIDVERVDEIPRGNNGKYEEFMSELS